MSMPNIPNITPDISITQEQAINLILASIALEELGQAHIINAEAEKIQYVLGTLEGAAYKGSPERRERPTIEKLLEINDSVRMTLRAVIKNQMLLQFKLEDAIELLMCSNRPKP